MDPWYPQRLDYGDIQIPPKSDPKSIDSGYLWICRNGQNHVFWVQNQWFQTCRDVELDGEWYRFRPKIGSILRSLWYSLLHLIWSQNGLFWTLFWTHFGVHFGPILGPFWGHFGPLFRTLFWVLFWHVEGESSIPPHLGPHLEVVWKWLDLDLILDPWIWRSLGPQNGPKWGICAIGDPRCHLDPKRAKNTV